MTGGLLLLCLEVFWKHTDINRLVFESLKIVDVDESQLGRCWRSWELIISYLMISVPCSLCYSGDEVIWDCYEYVVYQNGRAGNIFELKWEIFSLEPSWGIDDYENRHISWYWCKNLRRRVSYPKGYRCSSSVFSGSRFAVIYLLKLNSQNIKCMLCLLTTREKILRPWLFHH